MGDIHNERLYPNEMQIYPDYIKINRFKENIPGIFQ